MAEIVLNWPRGKQSKMIEKRSTKPTEDHTQIHTIKNSIKSAKPKQKVLLKKIIIIDYFLIT
jgi:hypothetical protein